MLPGSLHPLRAPVHFVEKGRRATWPPARLRVAAFCVCCVLAGCGGSVPSTPQAGPILIVGAAPSGASANDSVLSVASTLKLSMTPVSDRLHAGVDWTVNCAGNPVTGSTGNGACGTLTPAHTLDGGTVLYTAPSTVPVGTTITITASVTSDPAQSSTASLTIVTTPVEVSFSSLPPASLELNAQQTLQALVSNDPAGAGVIWTASCASSACGSFNPPTSASNTTYTAPSVVPSGGTVTIAATSLTDTTKSASASVTITAPPSASSIGVSIFPASLYVQTVGAAHNGRFTALVTGDSAAAGVDWSLACGASSCGSISDHTASGVAATYSAPSAIPPGGLVTVTASSTTNPLSSASADANVVAAAPIAVTLSSAPPATLPTGTTLTLAATVVNDASSLGVDWTASCGSPNACGTFNLSPAHTASAGPIVYTAPAAVPSGGVVTITASSSSSLPANAAIATTTIVAQPPSIALTQAPASTLLSAAQTPVTATVTNDAAPGGIAWTIAPCGSTVAGGCGWISPVHTASGVQAIYTAPPVTTTGTSVTVVATSIADPSASVTSTPIAILPNTTLAVSFVPALPSQMQPNATVSLSAAVANDASDAGLDWQVCPSGCGFFTLKPAIAAIPATATTPYVPAIPAVTATTVSAWSNDLPIPYTAPVQPPSGGLVAVAAFAHADPSQATSGTITISNAPAGPALNGLVEAGSQPVTGASVALYAAGTSGYASPAAQLASALTDASGSFTLPPAYSCPSAASQVYLVAVGGAAGTSPRANPNLSLMTTLGSCSALSSAPVLINEVTTVASAVATAPFAANDTLSGNSSFLYLGTSSGNLSGMANAFASVNNLVDTATGQARFLSPAGNAVVPYVQINTLANALNACAVTSGGIEGDGSPCGTLFTATDVLLNNHQLYNAVGPADTLQAAFNLAQHPVANYGYTLDVTMQLLPLATPSSPFQPILTTQPNDWSVSLHYTGGGGLSAASTVGSFAIDAAGDLWITDTTAGSVIEWNSFGAALSPSAGFPAGGGPLAIDASSNVWVSGNGALTELTSLGTPAPGSPFGGVPGGGSDLAIDAQGDIWIPGGAGVSEFSNLGVTLSPAGGFTFNNLSGLGAVGVDSANNVWVGNVDSQNAGYVSFAELTNPGGALIANGQSSFAGTVTPQFAADHGGDIWASVGANGICEVPPHGGRGTTLIPTCYESGNATGNLLLANPAGLSLDGAGVVWVASQGGGNNPVILPSVLPVAPSLLGSNTPNYLVSPSLSAGPLRVAVDGSGNVWVLLADNTVTEYVGVATPVVTPIAEGVKTNTLAAKP